MTSNSPDPEDSKQEWRRWAAHLQAAELSDSVTAALQAWPPLHGVVATYLAMESEVDVAGVSELPRCRVLVPRAEAGGDLSLHPLTEASLVRHPYGFDEPDSSSLPVDLYSVDVVLVHGLAFDVHGNRLGRGAGMYDRLLAGLPIGVVRVGVTVDAAIVDNLPVEQHDQAVDWLATESGVRP
ncbi:MAG: 5-formyltetrahydrofolate cyclo-ligase, partial [Acidimicrobiia bacterium]